jgi:phosphopentomutase
MQPPETVLNRLSADKVDVIGVGKISDIYAGSGITESHPTGSNVEGCETIDRLLAESRENDHLIFTNLVDFDMLYGHRRNPEGYAGALEEFDQWLETFLPKIDDDTLVIISDIAATLADWFGIDYTGLSGKSFL